MSTWNATLREYLQLACPSVLQLLVDWARPLLFNVFVSLNVRASSFSEAQAGLELDAVSISVL